MFKKICNGIVNSLPMGEKDKDNGKDFCHAAGVAVNVVGKGALVVGRGLVMGVFTNATPTGPERPNPGFDQMDESNYNAERIEQYHNRDKNIA